MDVEKYYSGSRVPISLYTPCEAEAQAQAEAQVPAQEELDGEEGAFESVMFVSNITLNLYLQGMFVWTALG